MAPRFGCFRSANREGQSVPAPSRVAGHNDKPADFLPSVCACRLDDPIVELREGECRVKRLE